MVDLAHKLADSLMGGRLLADIAPVKLAHADQRSAEITLILIMVRLV